MGRNIKMPTMDTNTTVANMRGLFSRYPVRGGRAGPGTDCARNELDCDGADQTQAASAVDFPHPDGPGKDTNSPWLISIDRVFSETIEELEEVPDCVLVWTTAMLLLSSEGGV
nr:hypothetical protein [uncultured Microbulbifer sp.]